VAAIRRVSSTLMKRRKLNLKVKLESSLSHFSFKRYGPGALNSQRWFDRVNLHRPTLRRL
jgi:hypothetical protein